MSAPEVRHAYEKRFEDFFDSGAYVVLKNHLYNYRLRKRAVEAAILAEAPALILEVGSGLSPMITKTDRVVYSELSHGALRTLRRLQPGGYYVVADSTRLPFREGAFSHAVCSEVLEHVEHDQTAINELARVIAPGGAACITVPHRMAYFAADDRFVQHFRRYEQDELETKIANAGLTPEGPTKILGPLEKITMLFAVLVYKTVSPILSGNGNTKPSPLLRIGAPIFRIANTAYAALATIDAKLAPTKWATVLMYLGRR